MEWIDRCLNSLRNSSYPLKVIIIDNLSTDGTFMHIQTAYPEMELMNAGANLGFGRANNIGIKKSLQAGADYIFLLNQDAWIKENTIEQLLGAAQENNEYGILSPFHLTAEGDAFEKQFAAFVSTQYTGMLVSDIFFNKLKTVYTTDYIHAAAWFMSAACIKKVGGFDPLYNHYGEDDDYMERAKYFGFKLGLVPAALVTHDAVYKTWDMVEWNENRNLIVDYKQLKKINTKFHSNLLVYLKNAFDELTTLLILRKFKKFRFRAKITCKVLGRLRAIHHSYQLSFKEGAFLYE